MNIDLFSFGSVQYLGDGTTHPIKPPATRLGSLLHLAGSSAPRCLAYPAAPPVAHSGTSY